MSMKDYDFSLLINRSIEIAAQGRYIYYLKGTTPQIEAGVGVSVAGNQAIRVRAASTSIVLLPGQSFRLPPEEKQPSAWRLENLPNAETITGTILIGEGDFRDSNTNNTNYLKLDASFANNVTVTNDAAHRVPVSLDPSQVMQITVVGTTVTYTNSYADTSIAAGTLTVFTAAQNPNGAFVEYAEMGMTVSGAVIGQCSLIAKATAPASNVDGDVILGTVLSNNATVNNKLPLRVRIPPGKGLYLVQNVSGGALGSCNKTVLYTVQ